MASLLSSPVATPTRMPPSSRSFFDDSSSRPNAFKSMKEWEFLRNFLYYFGITHKNERRGGGISARNFHKVLFTDKRSIVYDIAKAMNRFQEDYSFRLSMVSLQGRLIAEAILSFYEPEFPKGYTADADVGQQIAELAAKAPHMKDLCDRLRRVETLGSNQGAHLRVASISDDDKASMIDGLYPCLVFLKDDLESRWTDESAAAAGRAVSQAGRSTWEIGEEQLTITEVSLWLRDCGLEEYCPFFYSCGLEDMDMLLFLKQQMAAADGKRDPDAQLLLASIDEGIKKVGHRIKVKMCIRELRDDCLREYQSRRSQAVTERDSADEQQGAEQRALLAELEGLDAVKEERSQSLREMRELGFDLSQYLIHFHLADLVAAFPLDYLRSIGVTGHDLMEIGIDRDALLRGGYKTKDVHSIEELADLGASPRQLVHNAGFSPLELEQAGFTIEQLRDHLDVKDLAAYWSLVDLELAGVGKSELYSLYMNTDTLGGGAGAVWCVSELASGELISGSDDGAVRRLDRGSGRCLAMYSGHTGAVWSCTELTDSNICSGSNDGSIKIFDRSSAACLSTLTGHTDAVYSVIQLADGSVCSASKDGTVRVWNLEANRCISTLSGHSGAVLSVAECKDGYVVSGSFDNTVKAWDRVHSRCDATLIGHSEAVWSVIELSDGALCSGSKDGTIRIWDRAACSCLATFNTHLGAVWSVVELRDGSICCGTGDSAVQVWDRASEGSCISTLRGHEAGVCSVVELVDSSICSASFDGTVRVWGGGLGGLSSRPTGGRTIAGAEDSMRL